jgi:hypothetical protein
MIAATTKSVRITGQPPKLRSSTGEFIAVVRDGFVLSEIDLSVYANAGYKTEGAYLTCEEGGGFQQRSKEHKFEVSGTQVKRIAKGDPRTNAITEFIIPVT